MTQQFLINPNSPGFRKLREATGYSDERISREIVERGMADLLREARPQRNPRAAVKRRAPARTGISQAAARALREGPRAGDRTFNTAAEAKGHLRKMLGR